MVAAIGHVVRRGFEAAAHGHLKQGDGKTIQIEISGWGATLLSVTLTIGVLILCSLEYTLKDVVATLTMVESPSADISLSATPEEANPLKGNGEEEESQGPQITLVRQKPITSNIRTTLRHLRAQAGRLSKWRGLGAFIVYSMAEGVLINIVDAVIPQFIPGRILIFSALVGVIIAPLHAAWTHTVISMPSNKRFWHRITPKSVWRQLALPAAVKAVAGYTALYVCIGFFYILRLHKVNGNSFSDYKGVDYFLLALRFTALIVVALLAALFIVLPATVTLVRVEASLLPEDDETIVPFDRSFAGKVVPTILGGTGAVSFIDAWKSFNWEARRRLVKLYAKISFIMFAVMLVMAHVIVFEAWIVIGPAIKKMMADAQQMGAKGEMHTW
jgi:hypothetical protein